MNYFTISAVKWRKQLQARPERYGKKWYGRIISDHQRDGHICFVQDGFEKFLRSVERGSNVDIPPKLLVAEVANVIHAQQKKWLGLFFLLDELEGIIRPFKFMGDIQGLEHKKSGLFLIAHGLHHSRIVIYYGRNLVSFLYCSL